jgi:Uma2 family endonuclease
MTRAAGTKLTYEDFLLFPDDGKRHELIDGEHYVTPSPNRDHQRIVGRLHLLIGSWLEDHPIGEAFLAPFDVVISNHDVVEPDLLYVSTRRADDILTRANLQGVPDLVIEVASPGTRKRDATLKRRLYEQSGAAEYWIVDPELEVIRVYRRDGNTFGDPEEFTREHGHVLTTPLLPGLDIPLARVFRE